MTVDTFPEVASVAAVAANTVHRTSDGTDHANVVVNDAHVAGDGSDHADVATNTGDIATNVTAIGLNTTHRGSDGKDHSDVVANTTASGLNTTHRGSAGTDHSDVGLNNTHRASNGTDHANVVTNDTHVAGDGSDHADVATNTAAVALLTPLNAVITDNTSLDNWITAANANEDIVIIPGSYTLQQALAFRSGCNIHAQSHNGGVVVNSAGYAMNMENGTKVTATDLTTTVAYGAGQTVFGFSSGITADMQASPTDYRITYNGVTYTPSAASSGAQTVTIDEQILLPATGVANVSKNYCISTTLSGLITYVGDGSNIEFSIYGIDIDTQDLYCKIINAGLGVWFSSGSKLGGTFELIGDSEATAPRSVAAYVYQSWGFDGKLKIRNIYYTTGYAYGLNLSGYSCRIHLDVRNCHSGSNQFTGITANGSANCRVFGVVDDVDIATAHVGTVDVTDLIV